MLKITRIFLSSQQAATFFANQSQGQILGVIGKPVKQAKPTKQQKMLRCPGCLKDKPIGEMKTIGKETKPRCEFCRGIASKNKK